MFSSPAPTSTTPVLPTTTTATSPTPASPSRPGRLRGLSYLRNYTQHLHNLSSSDSSRNTPPPLNRSTSFQNNPTSPTTRPPLTRARTENTTQRISTSPQRTQEQNGWLPAAGGRSGSTQEQSVAVAESLPSQPEDMTRNQPSAVAMRNGRDTSAAGQLPSIWLHPFQDTSRGSRPSLVFNTISRTLPNTSAIVRVGRYSERDGMPEVPSNIPSSAPIGFKSKVVSRKHCEIWCSNGQWYIKDVKSSSGTFLNYVRLSAPNEESRAFPLNDGDIVQLGIDFKGGEEMIFRCVKIRVECNRGWQKAPNKFNKSTHKQLQSLAKGLVKNGEPSSAPSTDCTICLMSIAPCQSLFVAPCSHVWHFKCIKQLLTGPNYPTFLCPNCRAMADLEANIEEAPEEEWEPDFESSEPAGSRRGSTDREAAGSSAEDGADGMEGVTSPNRASLHNNKENEAPAGGPSSPIPIASRRASHAAGTSHTANGDISNQMATTPDLADLQGPDGPLTPRNTAGPFVFDGSAGRSQPSSAVLG